MFDQFFSKADQKPSGITGAYSPVRPNEASGATSTPSGAPPQQVQSQFQGQGPSQAPMNTNRFGQSAGLFNERQADTGSDLYQILMNRFTRGYGA